MDCDGQLSIVQRKTMGRQEARVSSSTSKSLEKRNPEGECDNPGRGGIIERVRSSIACALHGARVIALGFGVL